MLNPVSRHWKNQSRIAIRTRDASLAAVTSSTVTHRHTQRGIVCMSVCVRHKRESCKTAKPIEMLFGVWTRRGLGNHALVGGPGSPSGRGTFLGGGGE